MFDMNNVFGKKTVDIIIKEIVTILKTFCVWENTKLYKFEWLYFWIIFDEKTTKEYLQTRFTKLTQFEFYNEGRHIPISFSLWIVLEEANIDVLLRNGYSAIKNSKKARKPIFSTKIFIEYKNLLIP